MAERNNSEQDEGNGCLIAVVIMVVAVLVAAVMSLAALLDPFAWLPTVEELWSDCADEECDLADRFPGYWGHTAINLVYDFVALLLVAALAIGAIKFRRVRSVRYRSPEDWERWRQGRGELLAVAGAIVAVAAIPIIVAAA